MLLDAGATIVEIGHSERRKHFGETDETVGRKVAAASRHGLTALVCVGEPWPVREATAAPAFIQAQLRAALAGSAEELLLYDGGDLLLVVTCPGNVDELPPAVGVKGPPRGQHVGCSIQRVGPCALADGPTRRCSS